VYLESLIQLVNFSTMRYKISWNLNYMKWEIIWVCQFYCRYNNILIFDFTCSLGEGERPVTGACVRPRKWLWIWRRSSLWPFHARESGSSHCCHNELSSRNIRYVQKTFKNAFECTTIPKFYRLFPWSFTGFLNANLDGYFKSPANFCLLDIIAALHFIQVGSCITNTK